MTHALLAAALAFWTAGCMPMDDFQRRAPRSRSGYVEEGYASWYGMQKGRPYEHGRLTASGVRYDMHAMTAAHKTLPLGTRVRVTNLENGRRITVVINDRGPYIEGRIIDLTLRGARQLGFHKKGVARVRIEAL